MPANMNTFPPKTAEWVNNADMAEKLGVVPSTTGYDFGHVESRCSSAKRNGADSFEALGITIPIDKAGYFKPRTGRPTFCIHESLVLAFDKATQTNSKELPEKTNEWITAGELAHYYNKAHHSANNRHASAKTAWKQAQENGEPTFTVRGITFPIEKAGSFFNPKNNLEAFCIHKSVADALEASMTDEKDPRLVRRHLAIQKRDGIQPKSIKPGSTDLKKSDREIG